MKKLVRLTAGLAASLLLLSPTWATELADETVSETVAEAAQQATEIADEATEVAQSETEIGDEATETESEEELVLSEEEEEEEESTSRIDPFFVSFAISNGWNLGAISRDEFTTEDYDVLNFGLTVGYRTPVPTLSVRLSGGFSQFLTESGGSTFQREGRVGDLTLRGLYGSFFEEPFTGIQFGASLAFSIPTSEVSRFTNLRTAIRPGVEIYRSFGDLTLSYTFAFKKNLHRDTTIVADLNDFDLDIIARDGGTENVGEAQVALDTGVLTEWALYNTLSISYVWFEGFSSFISLSFGDFFSYDNGTITRDDEFTNENAVPGRGHSQTMTGSIGVGYSFLEYFGVSLSMDTTQPPKTADNQNIRFPFFDLESGNLQNTTMTLSLTASY